MGNEDRQKVAEIAQAICAQHTAISLPFSRPAARFEIERVEEIIAQALTTARREQREVDLNIMKEHFRCVNAAHSCLDEIAAAIRKQEVG